jgi:hypothetical protein
VTRLSKLCPAELFDLLKVALRDPARVLKWIIDNLVRPLPWEGSAELLNDRAAGNEESFLLDNGPLDGIDLANAVAVLSAGMTR